jgi:hypothetical protein
MQQEYDDFMADYNFTVYEVTDENREIVKAMDPKYVWTSHTTCEDSYVSPGFLEFSPSNCCWHEEEWYVSETPWATDDSSTWIRTSHNFACTICNPDGELDEGAKDCAICEGIGFYQYYTD